MAGKLFGWCARGCAEEDLFCVEGVPVLSEEEEEVAFELKKRYLEAAGASGLDGLLAGICEEMEISLDAGQEEDLKRFVLIDAEWGGPLGVLSCDERLEEVAVIGVGKPMFVYVRGEGWRETNCQFTSMAALVEAINKMAKPLGRRVTLKSPRINAVLKNGCRLHASIPPLSDGEVTIRRFRETPFSPSELVGNGTFSTEAMAFLSLAMQCDSSIIVAGNTGSGKTSTLNSLFSFVPLEERVLITEETPEIRVPQPHCCRLVARDELNLGLGELAADSLRMRPDRVIVGEARDSGEAKALFDAMLSGQARGCYATMHARSAEEALARLCSLGIPERDLAALDLVVVQRRIARFSNGRFSEARKCVEICEVEDGKAERLFELDFDANAMKKVSPGKKMNEKICRTFGFDGKRLEAEIGRRVNCYVSEKRFGD